MSIANPETKSIHALLSENEALFHIPAYQREYSWQNIQLEDLWDDLEEVLSDDSEEHFFGQIVTNTSENGYEVIDGQQRLITSTLLLAAIRDVAKKFTSDQKFSSQLSEDERYSARRKVDDIQENYLLASNLKTPILTLPDENDVASFFTDLLIKGRIVESDNQTEKNLRNAYLFLKKHVSQYIAKKESENLGVPQQLKRLENLIQVFTKRFKVILINTASTKDGFVIFETLNARGKSLEEADLLKNLLLGFLSDDEESANSKWERIFTTLNRDSNETSRYIRAYWAFNVGLVNKDKLFRAMRKSNQLQNSSDAQKVLEELAKYVGIYYGLLKGLKSRFKDQELADLVDTASVLVKTFHPVVLAMYDRSFKESDVRKVLKKILSVYAVNIFILGEVANDLEKDLVKVSRGIKTGIIANVEEINKKLDEIEKKEQAILTLPVWNRDKWTQNQSRNTNQGHVFLLAELLAAQPDETISSYELFKGNGNPKYRLIRLANLDQLASDAAYINKFGNYTLLEKKINWNEEWSLEEKADHLMRSKIINNRLMAPKFSQWNADIINNRTKQFVGNMRAIW
ncbi:DUF262 domain-containing protein [Leuconostoc falkenbergense]|jgi:uncharacterized protein with ParB-like and HNH nuclease domain|uniref:DUF262 domain-containing protein n=1 Tax=Leuconostoc falkenbergense TaxID=2766470 RepID=A0A9X3EEW3_9LACO|nr:DUF262 domain-containing protein [Leuconostoc falkenbergense]RDG18889.1 hypothetical protein DQM11_04725 [Leuconostoc pseudomesenteroides]MCT4389597.1 DUF262 domain-containing protein [Leuconostoc falkenbergense]MCX7579513.1 DUF262 domain-containing protein [Leuconostoc falkenbergense]MDV3545419.1 DUF262 domain-containing protein [Leuconostoc falkenbergense]VTU69461.1 hypothetical protein [Lactobacillus farciminis KCTC 3681 = DSM 20184] [Leuconostoc pseudomesenteroides]